MKIKTKKQLNLPQLIEWAMENDVDNTIFIGKKNLYNVCFNKNGLMYFNTTSPIPTGEIFTVEIEEEITLTTPLPAMLHVWKTGILGTEIKEVENKSIASQYTVCSTEFWLKQDDEMTLIWRDGKLVE